MQLRPTIVEAAFLRNHTTPGPAFSYPGPLSAPPTLDHIEMGLMLSNNHSARSFPSSDLPAAGASLITEEETAYNKSAAAGAGRASLQL